MRSLPTALIPADGPPPSTVGKNDTLLDREKFYHGWETRVNALFCVRMRSSREDCPPSTQFDPVVYSPQNPQLRSVIGRTYKAVVGETGLEPVTFCV
jgi:hypothetical protein